MLEACDDETPPLHRLIGGSCDSHGGCLGILPPHFALHNLMPPACADIPCQAGSQFRPQRNLISRLSCFASSGIMHLAMENKHVSSHAANKAQGRSPV